MDLLLLLRPNLLAANPGLKGMSEPVQHDEIGVGASAKRSLAVLDAETPGENVSYSERTDENNVLRRVISRAFDGVAERAASEADKVADTLVQGDDAAGNVSE